MTRPRTLVLSMIAVAAVGLAAFFVYMSPGGNGGRARGSGIHGSGTPGAIGTSGGFQHEMAQRSGPSMPAQNVIHEIETITGVNDGHELVGRRVDLHVPVQQHINDVAFWVGSRDNRLLVVLARDNRDGSTRQRGEPSSTSLGRMGSGQMAIVAGTVDTLPRPGAMASWGLTDADTAELMERRIYVRADTVTAVQTAAVAP
jgi:hypothetical protein